MTARLFSKIGKTRGLELELTTHREAIVGRDPASNLVIERPLMSGRHARIFYDTDAERFVLEDLKSLNGTEVDGDRVTGTERLGHLNVITFAGNYDFFFFDSDRCSKRHPEPPPAKQESASEPAPAAKTPVSDTDEVTSIEKDPVALPDFLARRADAMSAEPSVETRVPSEITAIEHEPIEMPSFLARRADDARTEREEAPTDETRVDDDPAGGKTMHEKLPVGLPDVLARRSEEAAEETNQGRRRPSVQKHETVDLSQIEELITAEETDGTGDRDAYPASGLHLIVTESGSQVSHYSLVEGDNLIGRGANADVALKYPDLSRRHAILVVAGENITIRDLGSRNRTFVDDVPVKAELDVTIEPGTRLRFGSVEARLAKVKG